VVGARSAVARLPEGLDLTEAATIPMTGLTVRLLLDRLALPPGSTLAVTGAAGAVGGWVTQLGAREGLRVIGIASPGDEETVRALGAAEFVPRGDGVAAAVRVLAPDGVDALVDAAVVGAPVLPLVRDDGKVCAVRPFDGEPERGISVELVSVRDYLGEPEKLAELLHLAAAGELRLRVAATYEPERAAEAHERLDAGGLRGRPVIVFP
jgi:NADPH:quinone reductase-like Zn-dependent oxidoreductase